MCNRETIKRHVAFVIIRTNGQSMPGGSRYTWAVSAGRNPTANIFKFPNSILAKRVVGAMGKRKRDPNSRSSSGKRTKRASRMRAAGFYRRRDTHRAEVKTVDTTVAGNYDTDSAVANCLFLLNTVPQDASPTGRVGKRIRAKGLAIRGKISAASAGTFRLCRTLLIWVRNPNQAATLPAVTEILVSQNSTSLSNRDGASKFKVLRSWDHSVIGNSTTPATGQEQHEIDEYVDLSQRTLHSVWTNAGTAGTIGQFMEGALLLLTVGNAANGATTTPVGNFNTRFYFLDD